MSKTVAADRQVPDPVIKFIDGGDYSPTRIRGFETIIFSESTNRTVNLPTAVGNRAEFTFVKTDSSANTGTIDGLSTEKIANALTYVLSKQNQSVTLFSDDTNWQIK